MKKNSQTEPEEIGNLEQKLAGLEERITRLERETKGQSNVSPGGFQIQHPQSDEVGSKLPSSSENSMESRIGEYGMAWMGNIVLLLGILFLTQYLQSINQEFISLVFGFAAVGLVYLIGYLTRESLPYMSRLFSYNGHLLLYIQTMRICLFQGSRVIDNPILGHAVVLTVLISLIYLAYRKNSQLLAVMAWLMAGVTAVASGNTHFMLPLMLGITGTSILFASLKGWWIGLITSVFLVYFIFLVWILGNPFLSRSLEFISNPQMGYVYLFACALAYSLLGLLPKSESLPQNQPFQVIIWNGLGFSFIFTLMVLSFFSDNYSIYFGLIAAFCIVYSVLLQLRGTWNNIAALYAIYSFVALSITISGIYHFPLAFFLLSIQSLLVVIVALWFRSRFMVIMNTILFAGLLIVYLTTAESLHMVNFSFSLVALATARILNWRKQRLEIRTELIRNIFLFSGAAMVLFSLHEAVPPNFVTLSWTLAAVVFFILSVLIHNMKYRWLAITTMIVTVFYLFIVDLSNISLGYRIVALMFIASISLGISIFYSKRQKSKIQEPD